MGLVRFLPRIAQWRKQHMRLVVAVQIVLGIVASLALGYLAVHRVEWAGVGVVLRSLPWRYALAATLVLGLSHLLRAYRWRLLFLRDPVSTWRLLLVQNTGIGFNNLMPVRVFSEATQFAMLTLRDGVSKPVALATLGVERVLDLVASATLLGVSLLLLPQLGMTLGVGTQIAITVSLAAGALFLLHLLAWASVRIATLRRLRLVCRLGLELAKMERHWVRTVGALLVTAAHWAALGLCAWVLAHGMGLQVSLVAMIATVVAVTFLTTSLPSLPAGIGTFELAAVTVLQLFGVGKAEALGLALALHVALYAPPILVALAQLPREGLGAMMPWLGSKPRQPMPLQP
ncbi:MAG: flippase-like domain-containing protein [Chloroflexi bacterium]|nr:flippase-like domain-containing protein [Chloroflexota bacterium]